MQSLLFVIPSPQQRHVVLFRRSISRGNRLWQKISVHIRTERERSRPTRLRESIQQLLRRDGPQLRQRAHAQRRTRQLRVFCFALRQRRKRKPVTRKRRPALPNRLLEQSLRQRRRHLRAYRKRSRALAKNRNVAGIAPERGNIFMHPAQRRQLIEQSVISRRMVLGFFRQLRMHKKSKHSQPVIHADHDHTLLRQNFSMLPRFRSSTRHESTTINPHHHRKLRLRRLRRYPHIQRQTIFTPARIGEHHVAVNVGLHAMRSKFRSLAHPVPLRRGHRRFPPQITHRRCRVRDAEKRMHLPYFLPFHQTGSRLHLQSRLRLRRKRRRKNTCSQHRQHSKYSRNDSHIRQSFRLGKCSRDPRL